MSSFHNDIVVSQIHSLRHLVRLCPDVLQGGFPEIDGYWSNIRNTSVLAFFRSLHPQAIKCFPLNSPGPTRSTVDRWLSNEDWMWYTAAQHVRRKSDLCMTDTKIHAVNGIWKMDLSLNVWLSHVEFQTLNENRVLVETLCFLYYAGCRSSHAQNGNTFSERRRIPSKNCKSTLVLLQM